MHKKTCFNPLNRFGFTLIEVMVVLIILSIMAMYLYPKITGRPEEARQIKARLDITSLESILRLYKLDNGTYPSTEQGLQALIEQPNTEPFPQKWHKGGYIEKDRIPKDPWGRDFVYLSPGIQGDFDIISYGADGVPGGEDENQDVNSWEIE